MHDIIGSKSLAILHVSLRWKSDFASHIEMFYVPLNVWRELDLFPHSLAQALPGQRAGFVLKASFSPGTLLLAHDKSRVRPFHGPASRKGQAKTIVDLSRRSGFIKNLPGNITPACP